MSFVKQNKTLQGLKHQCILWNQNGTKRLDLIPVLIADRNLKKTLISLLSNRTWECLNILCIRYFRYKKTCLAVEKAKYNQINYTSVWG